MTMYSLPEPPSADHVWLRRHGATRWVRVPCIGRDDYRPADEPRDAHRTWAGLLATGEVSDVHPDSIDISPLPWMAGEFEGDSAILSADGEHLLSVVGTSTPGRTDDANRDLIVRAVNDYAARQGLVP